MRSAPTPGHWTLTDGRRATLVALARCIAPHAFSPTNRGEGLVTALSDRIGRMSATKRGDFELALDVIGSRWAALISGLPPVTLANLRPAQRDTLLRRWMHSRIGTFRTVAQGIRRFVLLVEYGTRDAQADVGYHGPPHTRAIEVDWEGPVRGVATDNEPVARAAGPATAPLPRPARSVLRDVVAPDGDRLRAEIVVIGSGAGGAVAACRLAEAGHDVLIIEAGSLVADEDFDGCEATALERLYADGALRATDDLSVNIVQGAVVGGGTTVNWMIMLRTPEHVLDEWAARHGTVGMDSADLGPTFDRIEEEVHTREVPADAHAPNNLALLRGAAALGWRARAARINARNCVRAGFCGYGCRFDAKQGALLTFLPRAVAAGARLLHSARADQIGIVETGGPFPLKRIDVTRREADGRTRRLVVEAPVIVVAGGAVETPLLLQRSGLGTDAVGRFLRLHPTTAVTGLYEHEMRVSAGIPLSTVCDEFLNRDGRGYGFWVECPHFHPAHAAAAVPGFGAAHRELMLQFGRTGAFIALVRDGADRDRSNGSVRAGRDGRAHIHYRLGEIDRHHMIDAVVAAARLHLAAGAQEVRTLHSDGPVVRSEAGLAALRNLRYGPNDFALYSAHVNGTCRLGADRTTSGTNPDGECWSASGVFVTDGSLLPTALGVNPQETIMALASVVAGRIAARRRPG